MYDVEKATNILKVMENFWFGLEENFKTTNVTTGNAMLELQWRFLRSDVKTKIKILGTLLVLQLWPNKYKYEYKYQKLSMGHKQRYKT